jgi:general secretion pathway protein F
VSTVRYKLLNDKAASESRPVSNGPSSGAAKESGKADAVGRIGAKQLSMLTRQLAILLHAGMPLVPALSALVEQLRTVTKNPIQRHNPRDDSLATVMENVVDRVSAGSTLAAACAEHPHVFSSLFVNMVAAGEASGGLEAVLSRLAQMLEKRVHLAGKVKSAVAYPLMMIVVATAVVLFLLSFVVPGITQIFLEMGRTLPWPTRLLIASSAFLRTYFLLIAVAVPAALFTLTAWYRTKKGRLIADRSRLKLPLFGQLFLKLEVARMTRILGTLLVSGVPILDALEIARRVVQNRFIAAALHSVRQDVSKGSSFAEAVRKTHLFPPIVSHILATGQISGDVETGLLNIADMYDGEVELTAKTLTSLLEPAILLLMGVVVGFIVLAVLLPIFEISQVF